MYDPLVVDTFIAAYPEIADLAQAAGQQARSLLDPSETTVRSAIDRTIRGNQGVGCRQHGA